MGDDAGKRHGGGMGFFLSLFAPGIGHGMVGQARRGAVWVAVLLVVWCGATVAALWRPAALLVGLIATVVITALCAIDASRVRRERIQPKGWLLLGALVLLTFGALPIVLAAVLRLYVVEAFKIPSGGMCPTFQVGDHLFVDKAAYRHSTPARGDVVVYTTQSPSGAPVTFIHRVVAVAGDQVRVADGRVSVNGADVPLRALGQQGCDGSELHEETLGTAHSITLAADARFPDPPTSVALRDGEVFVLGDNRPNSHDSRQTGPIKTSAVTGRASIVWLTANAATWREIR